MASDLEAFKAYRTGLLSEYVPTGLTAVVWLQNGMETLAAVRLVASWGLVAQKHVIILGNDSRYAEERAPSVSGMISRLPAEFYIENSNQAMNTKDQAQIFWDEFPNGAFIIITAGVHIPRASLTFERWRGRNPAHLYWQAPMFQTQEGVAEAELAKIAAYSAKGDCLPLPEVSR